MLVAGALLGFEIVLDVDEQAGLPGALLRLAGGPGPAGDPGGQCLLGVVGAQGLQSGEPLLARSPGGDVLAPFQFVSFPLEPTEQVLQVGAAGQEPVDGGAQLRLVAGAVLFRLVLDVALALVPAGDDDGQAMFFADTVAGATDLMVASLVGVVVPVILETDRIENQVIMDMIPVYVGGEDKFIFAAQDLPRQLHADPVGFLRCDLPRLKRLDEVPAQVRSLVDGVAAGPGKFNVGGVHLDDIPVNRHLPQVGAISLCGELAHLLVDEPLFLLCHPELHLDISFSICHAISPPFLIRVWDYPSKQFLCLGAGVPLNRKSASGYSLAVLATVTLFRFPPLLILQF